MNAALVVMAAGLGSRYGGIKQIAGLGPKGEILLEYAVYDALEAGFDRVIMIVKEEILEDVKRLCGDRLSAITDVQYAIQSYESLPAFYRVPAGRSKPFGTVHAVLSAAPYIDRPFAVINADDYYGKDAFVKIYEGLKTLPAQGGGCMVGYRLKNTVSRYGAVTRGVCTEEGGALKQVVETYEISPWPDGTIRSGEEELLDPEALVSMNIWGFMPSVLPAMQEYFEDFLRGLSPEEIKKECLLPTMVDDMIHAGSLSVAVLSTDAEWFGVTYRDDREKAMLALQKLHAAGAYPASLR